MCIWNRTKDCIMPHHRQGEYRLKREKNKDYSKVFFDVLVPYKTEVFKYIQTYYRCFMNQKDIRLYPIFNYA